MFSPDRQMKFNFLETPVSRVPADQSLRTKKTDLSGLDSKLTQLCIEVLGGLNLRKLEKRVTVEWNARMRSCAGRAFWPQGKIQLNPKLIEISEDEVKQTLLHELAHLISYERNPRRRINAHGVEWQQACVDVGIPGEKATHQLALPSRVLKRRWRYQCPECKKIIDRVRRFKGVVACYDCCLEATGGLYHDSFRLKEIRLSS